MIDSSNKHSCFPLTPMLLAACLSCLVPLLAGVAPAPQGREVQGTVNVPHNQLYDETPAVLVTGNRIGPDTLEFHPKGDRAAGYFDSDGDGTLDTRINDFESFANAANNIFNEQVAACVFHNPGDRAIYDNPDIWTDDDGNPAVHLRPDTMPEFADSSGAPSTAATQFIQVKLPFNVDPLSIFSTQAPAARDYLIGTIAIEDETGAHVPCTVVVNGFDVFGNGPYDLSPNWPAGAEVGRDIVTFIAQTGTGRIGVPKDTALTSSAAAPGVWSGKEIRLSIRSLRAVDGTVLPVSSHHLVRRTGLGVLDDDVAVRLVDISATDFVINPNTEKPLHDQWPGVDSPDDLVVTPKSAFVVTFNKPVVPVTVGRSVVFNMAPYRGNTAPVPNRKALQWPPPPECTGTINPLCPNIVLHATLLDSQGTPLEPGTPIPFRAYPLNQNNMATFLIDPVIDLPGSSVEKLLPQQIDDVRMRIEISVYDYLHNDVTGDPDGSLPVFGPENLGVAGFHGERFYADGAPRLSRSFSVLDRQRYVNAPVSPNAIYFSMGRGGVGAIDLDGNGFTTNTPGSGKAELVTCTAFYNPFGSVMMGTGNNYSYPVGLGRLTPIPGVNEGSSGTDTLVRDSNGSAQLYPEAVEGKTPCNIVDMEVGGFLDVLYRDNWNPYASDELHSDLVYPLGGFTSNTISSPPTPNPPPLTVPVAMNTLDTILDNRAFFPDGAYTIPGHEVFTVDMCGMSGMYFDDRTGFIHLGIGGMSPDYPLPPYPPGVGPWSGVRFLNTGPMAAEAEVGVPLNYASRQQIGNLLFASDKAHDAVRVLNSNTMEEIARLGGLDSPHGLVVTPDLRRLYVSNRGSASVTVFDVDPFSESFLEKVCDIAVGEEPMGICCQPDYEDVFVCNYGSSTISIIDPRTNTVRKTLTRLIDRPVDMTCGPRQQLFGWGTQVYHGYVCNEGGDNILVFESGPHGIGGVGYDDIIGEVPLVGQGGTVYEKIANPRAICYDPLYLNGIADPLNLVGGCFVAHSTPQGAAVTRIDFVNQNGPWGPILNPTGTPNFRGREFLITAQWTALSGSSLATDVALPDFNRHAWKSQNVASSAYVTSYGSMGSNPSPTLPANNKHPIRIIYGSAVPTWMPDFLYVSFDKENTIDVIELASGSVTSIAGLPGPAGKLKTFFKN